MSTTYLIIGFSILLFWLIGVIASLGYLLESTSKATGKIRYSLPKTLLFIGGSWATLLIYQFKR